MATTLGNAITTVLQRVNLSTSVEAHKDQARKYLSMMAAEVHPLIPWWYLDRTTTFKTTLTFTITGAVGTFTAAETITGGTSAKTAKVNSYDSTNAKLYVYSESGTFTANETITGGSSGATATYSSKVETRVYQPISGAVTNWWSFTNEADDLPLEIIGYDQFDSLDPDRSRTGSVSAVLVGGVNTTTGYPEIELFYTPSTTNQTIRVRYRIDIAAWTSSNDSTNLIVLGIPRIMESVLVYGASALYLEQNRAYDMAAVEGRNLERAMEAARAWNRRMQGNRRFPPKSADDGMVIQVGTDLAVSPY